MKPNPIPVIAALLLLSFSLAAQHDSRYDLLLKGGTFTPEKNITAEKIDQFNRHASRIAGKTFAVIQFEQIPTLFEKQQLFESGIELLDYIPNNAYTATISGVVNADDLNRLHVRALVDLPPTLKMDPLLVSGKYPSWALNSGGTVDVWISFPKTFSLEAVNSELHRLNFVTLPTPYDRYRIISVRLATSRLGELASLPFVDFVQAIPKPAESLNYNSMFTSRANVIRASLANGGKELTGQGVVVGVGDDGDVQHLDFTGRLIDRSAATPGAHAIHVTGTVGGAGNIQEIFTGYAPKATLLSQLETQIIAYAPVYVQDHGMVIANNSYGSVANDCDYNGLYDLTARILDQQAFDLPELQQVFAAGNDGTKTCSPYPGTFKTVLGGFQCSKNVLTVGSTNFNSVVSNFSSKGPVRDGRLKPEIMSMGEFEASTWVNNGYSYNNGTSMAAPGVSGGLALLIERYHQLHAGANPQSNLMKAILCNGANDKGNAGPDFKYGFGQMNLIRSLAMVENATYFTSNITTGSTNTENISVPANTAQLKVLLYWKDPAASLLSSHTLVNDLDLQVVTPAPATVLPLVLDTLPANVNLPASPGVDHINNIEQVVINNPTAGNYSLKTIGTAVLVNSPQEYQLVYDIIPESLVLTNPVGGEKFTPNGTYFFGATILDTLYIQWDDYSLPNNELFTLEFSSNNGTTWSTISSTIPASTRLFKWAIPNIGTEQARIRLSKNNTAYTQTSNAFIITTLPVVSLAGTQCEGYISITWPAITGATDYEAMMLRGNEMVSIGTTNTTSYTFSGLSKDSTYWVTVRARINGVPGRRANAISRQPNSGTCSGSVSDNDLKIDSIISPATSGRKFTVSELSNNVPITIRIKNLDDAVSSGDINVTYRINGGPIQSETITTPIADIAAGGTLDHTFAVNADLSAIGTYSIEVTATKASDPVTANNSLTKIYKQLANAPITITDLPWLDNFDGMPEQSFNSAQMGLIGNDRYDFVNSTVNGRIRSFINSGMSWSGTRAITLDMDTYSAGGNVDSLTGTFNLNTFTTADDIRLDFRYKNHGQQSNAANAVWIRGSENDSWIKVYDLYANQNKADGTYKLSSSIELSDSLLAHGQTYSTSFQARWGQWGVHMAADNEGAAGYSFDNIRLYKAVDDIQAISIDTPYVISCGLNAAVPVRATIHNSSSATINNVVIVLKVDGNLIATDNIATILGNETIQHQFSATANISAATNHTIEVWTELLSDSFHENDTVRATINSMPLVTTYPYLEDFESGAGSWYTSGGVGNTWEYGSPVSPHVSRAASGTKAWKTHIAGYYNNLELAYLFSPCFNLSSMTTPTLSFSFSLNAEDCGAGGLCDGAWVEYSTDGGTVWTKLGAVGQGTNWYNRNYSGNHLWSQQNYSRWHVATIPLPTTNNSKLRLRFVLTSDESVTKDGIAVDDIHIYDNIYGIDNTTGAGPTVNQPSVSGTGWIDFIDPNNNKLIASVNPNGQNMGSTNVRCYVNTGSVRINSDQFYHDRNITIKPANIHLADSVTVRFYFLDTETEALISATGCSYCTKPSMAYELGISKYSDPADTSKENGTLSDNTPGNYIFINSSKTRIVPFDKGYYAEFKVKDFSEFWLNKGGFNNNTPLPVDLMSFTAKKQNGKDVLAEWVTATEQNVSHFELELAKGNIAYQQNQFIKIADITAVGNSNTEQRYSFTDLETNKLGVRYYRLKIVDIDGRSTYSAVRPVVFTNDVQWTVYPNPSHGVFYLTYQASEGEAVSIKVYDANGRVVQDQHMIATGFLQKSIVSLPVSGLYLLDVKAGEKRETFKLTRQ